MICLNRHYGCRSVAAPNPPDELSVLRVQQPAVVTLQAIVDEFNPSFVLTTSWLMLMERQEFEGLFDECVMTFVANRLHVQWEAPTLSGTTRYDPIEPWLASNHRGEPFVVLDDTSSRTDFAGSRLDVDGRVVARINNRRLTEAICRKCDRLHVGRPRSS